MKSLPDDYKAIVIGASGGIGAAMVRSLRDDPRCARVEALHRRSTIAIDFDDETSIAAAAEALRPAGPFHLIINAAGILHMPRFGPEKKLADLNYAQMTETFRINTFGPTLVVRHFVGLLDRRRAVLALLSARVGSIGDNRLGGWYSYRASKAALNMIVKTASIEFARSHPGVIVAALHPGTVDTALSKPFGGARVGRDPSTAAGEMLATLDNLTSEDNGRFVAYDGKGVAW